MSTVDFVPSPFLSLYTRTLLKLVFVVFAKPVFIHIRLYNMYMQSYKLYFLIFLFLVVHLNL